jgi:hypothetical protein
VVANKVPQRGNSKKPASKSLKEKRESKKAKRNERKSYGS